MPKQHIEGLISELHDRFADSDTSPQQEAMLAQMKSELAEWEGPKPSEDFRTTAERLLQGSPAHSRCCSRNYQHPE